MKTGFNQMVISYYKKVYRVSLYYLKNSSEAEDITQDVFLKIYQNKKITKYQENIFPLLFVLAKNLSLNRLKSKGWKESSMPDQNLIPSNNNIEDEIIRDDEIKEINVALGELKDEYRDILILKHYQNCSYKEISEILNIPVGTVMSRIYNARKKLGEKLKGVSYGE